MELLELIRTWPVWAQLIFLLITSLALTNCVVVFINGFTRDFMNALTILFRGWPPEHVQPDVEIKKDVDE